MIYGVILMVILLFRFALSTDVTNLNKYQEKIAWGRNVYQEGAYPYFLSIQRRIEGSKMDFYHACGGSLLGSRIMITAAHCFRNSLDSSSFRVFPNIRNTLIDQGQYFKISKYLIHPEYKTNNPKYYDHDIAVALLNRADPRHNVGLSLPIMSLPRCTQLKMMGFGPTEFGNYANRLREATVFTLTDEECLNEAENEKYSPVNHMCVTNKYGSSACPSDAGGPLVWQNPSSNKSYLYGVVRNELSCKAFQVTIATNVFAHLKFITQSILELTRGEF